MALKRLWTHGAARAARGHATTASWRCTSRPSCGNAPRRWSTIQREVRSGEAPSHGAPVAGRAATAEHAASSIVAVLRTMLAAGAALEPEEIDEDTAVHRPRPRLDHRRDLDPQDQRALRHGHRGHQGLQPSDAGELGRSREAGDREGGDARPARARCRARDDPPIAASAAAPAQVARAPVAPESLVSWRHQPRAAPRIARTPTATPRRHGTSRPIAVIGMAGSSPRRRTSTSSGRTSAAGRNCIDRSARGALGPRGPLPGGRAGARQDQQQVAGRAGGVRPVRSAVLQHLADRSGDAWIRSSACSCRRAGTASRTPATARSRCPAATCGVFVGCGPSDYHQASREHQLSAQGFTGAATSILAARISYFLNLQGPCISIDTACSSSLVAIANACDSLIAGNSDLALAGGVYVMAGPAMHIMTSQAGMLSPDGRCFTFDQRANGFVPGEGVGVVVLKRLADCRARPRPHPRRDRRLGRQPGRQDQRHHGAQRRVADAAAAVGLPTSSASIPPASSSSRRTAPARSWAIRSRWRASRPPSSPSPTRRATAPSAR